MVVLVTDKNEEDPSKNEGTRQVTTFLPLYGDFPDTQGQLTWGVPDQILLNFIPIQDFMVILVT